MKDEIVTYLPLDSRSDAGKLTVTKRRKVFVQTLRAITVELLQVLKQERRGRPEGYSEWETESNHRLTATVYRQIKTRLDMEEIVVLTFLNCISDIGRYLWRPWRYPEDLLSARTYTPHHAINSSLKGPISSLAYLCDLLLFL
jgi:hypothetical protein